jgi:pilus assembly protein CpaB
MKSRTIAVVLLALLCGASAAVGVNQLNQQRVKSSRAKTVPVVIAAKDMPRGGVLSAAALTVSQWPDGAAPAGALSRVEDADDRSILVPLVKGEPVLESKLASKDAGRGLASMIPSGMRAFTIRTPHVSSGVAGFILPGNRVDVLLTTTNSGANDSTGGGATTTLLQNVQVLAVAQRLDAPETNKVDPRELTSVTLLVTPDQAAKLDLGMNKGTLHLSLRNPEDDREADTRPATMAQLRFHQEKPNHGALQLAQFVGALTQAVRGGDGDAEKPPMGASRPRTAQIRTLRGMHRGSLRVEHSP